MPFVHSTSNVRVERASKPRSRGARRPSNHQPNQPYLDHRCATRSRERFTTHNPHLTPFSLPTIASTYHTHMRQQRTHNNTTPNDGGTKTTHLAGVDEGLILVGFLGRRVLAPVLVEGGHLILLLYFSLFCLSFRPCWLLLGGASVSWVLASFVRRNSQAKRNPSLDRRRLQVLLSRRCALMGLTTVKKIQAQRTEHRSAQNEAEGGERGKELNKTFIVSWVVKHFTSAQPRHVFEALDVDWWGAVLDQRILCAQHVVCHVEQCRVVS